MTKPRPTEPRRPSSHRRRITALATRSRPPPTTTDALQAPATRRPAMDRHGRVVPVRLDPALRDAVEARAHEEHTTTSEVIRRALRSFLDVA